MSKYKVGDRKVFVIDKDELGSWSYGHPPPFDKFVGRAVETVGEHHIYLVCNRDEVFNDGDLIAAECVRTYKKDDINVESSDWKRIGDD